MCKWKRPEANNVHDYMFYMNEHIQSIDTMLSAVTIIQTVPMSVIRADVEFNDYIVRSNEMIGNSQVIALQKLQTFAQNSELYEGRQADIREKCLEMWRIPDETRTAPDRTERFNKKFSTLLNVSDQKVYCKFEPTFNSND